MELKVGKQFEIIHEKNIEDFKNFYRSYLIDLPNKKELISQLYLFCKKIQEIDTPILSTATPKQTSLLSELDAFTAKFLGGKLNLVYNKKIFSESIKKEFSETNNILLDFIQILLKEAANQAERKKSEWVYKKDLLIFIYNCLNSFGLHNSIKHRKSQGNIRYNVLLEHKFNSKHIQQDLRSLISEETLYRDIISTYERKQPILFKGKLIPFKSIVSIAISSTLLKDDEIDLFALKHGFVWSKTQKDEYSLHILCENETDNLLRNPFSNVLEDNVLRNGMAKFISPDRISQLSRIQRKDFDPQKLIELCNELNACNESKSLYALSMLQRSLIDHIPTIFGYKSFTAFANNYPDGTKSFKTSMLKLDSVLRNIADNSIHSQARKKEINPTINQMDFTQEIDLLLGELIRIKRS